MSLNNSNSNPMIFNQGQDLVNTRSHLYLNNLFFTIVEPRLFLLYSLYLKPSLEAYDGIIPGFHDFSVGRTPQGLIQSIAQGTKQLIFKKPVSFNVKNDDSYDYFKDWASKTNFNEILKQAWLNACSGGTALLRLNESANGIPWVDTQRIDRFFVDCDNRKRVTRCVVYIDSFKSVSNKGNNVAYSLVEERYFKDGIPYRVYNYYCAPSLVNINTPPRVDQVNSISFTSLPNQIQNEHLREYNSIKIGVEQRLPYHDHLGVSLMRFEESIPGYEALPLGASLAEKILNDSCQYDISKQFGTLEGYVALPRIMVPTPYRKHGDNQLQHSLDGFVYVKYDVAGSTEGMKPEAMQFQFRTGENRIWRNAILEDIALKLNLSANIIASFLNDNTAHTTATSIIASKDKTDMFISDKAAQICPPVNELLRLIAFKKGLDAPLLELHPQDIIDPTTLFTIYGKQLESGYITPELYVKKVYAELDRKTQAELIEFIKQRQIEKMPSLSSEIV